MWQKKIMGRALRLEAPRIVHVKHMMERPMMERPVVLCTMMVCPVLARIIIPGHSTSLVVLGFYEVDPIIEI
jgi:hypothetical protein